ncbi:MAG: Zn-dependent alcohol dehydrogenase [Acidobacteriia bacterium]|nr:Zn-dependent alcohol dehydrogenase [Terriglobia bacterium]
MHIHAAILWEQGQPLSVEAAELDGPGPGELLVEIKAAGVCHSDLHPARGDWAMKVPVVLGHEGAGIVRDVGPNVTRVRKDDHVVLCWAPACGVCPPCKEGRAVLCDRLEKVTYRNKLPSGAARLHARGKDVAPFLGTACFSDFVVVPEEAAVPVPRDLRLDALATIGCAVLTGVGAVTNAARVPAGSRVLVIGAGGIGLNVIQGAAIEKCEQIIALDLRPAPLALAKQFGATHCIEGTGVASTGTSTGLSTNQRLPSPVHDVPAAIRELTGGRGADFVFDTVGSPATLATAIACTRKGGAVVLTGLSRQDAQGSIPMFPFVMQEKRLIGSVYGSGQPLKDIPRLVSLYQAGRLKLDELVSRTYPLDKVNDALAALAASDGARGVIRW